MKSFGTFLKEGGIGYHPNPNASKTLSNPEVLASINNQLTYELMPNFLTVYIGLERVRKVLAPFGATIPGYVGMKPSKGEEVIPVAQFGGAIDNQDRSIYDGKPGTDVVYLYWRWRQNSYGVHCFAQLCKSEEEVDALMIGEGHVVHLSYNDPSGTGRASANIDVASDDKEEAKYHARRKLARHLISKHGHAYKRGIIVHSARKTGVKPVNELSTELINRYKEKAKADTSIFKKDSHKRIWRRAKGLALANKKS